MHPASLSGVEILSGDARAIVPALPRHHFDAVITDPPYGIKATKFSPPEQRWDLRHPGANAAWEASFWRDVRRTLRPGASLAAFGHPRTIHRMVTAIEDGGFRVLDQIAWVHAQGFVPGNRWLDVELERLGHPDASTYAGWGTTLRPALELIVVARNAGKSLSKAIAHRDGTGGLNIDATRIQTSDERSRLPGEATPDAAVQVAGRVERSQPHPAGRHTPNVILEHAPGCGDELSCVPGCPVEIVRGQGDAARGRGEDATRFYSVIHHPKPRVRGQIGVKPSGVIGFLSELLTRPGDVVLDPFAGSGTILGALEAAGRRGVGIERGRV